MKRGSLRKKSLLFALGILFAVALYERVFLWTEGKFLPEFFTAFSHSFLLLGKPSFLVSLGYTILRSLIGLLVSLVLGFLLGLFAGYYPSFSFFLSPFVSILRSIPRIALIFLLALYVPHFYLAVVFLLCFPLAYEASKEGSKRSCLRFRRQFLLDGNEKRKNIFFVCLPLSLPDYGRGLRQCLGLSFKAEIRAETFGYTSSFKGIGKSLYLAYQDGDFYRLTEYVRALLLLLIALDVVLNLIKERRWQG